MRISIIIRVYQQLVYIIFLHIYYYQIFCLHYRVFVIVPFLLQKSQLIVIICNKMETKPIILFVMFMKHRTYFHQRIIQTCTVLR